ncbi:myoD family inhibitor domain-containing protein 2-like [Hyla sarda]|uniref:myoD family inhibitor domain-containing protein 2-like n=1 Tax=Hyla sarda TaxID=327740 RepID=UPI0024C429D3|nr:myoD family inhibitor domain-containing protein 2-like [Hyla sarda]XP_056397028.1 myoD family inhibitor domain-containing protein 2-like [Hyla sarda]XP_056397029.1 myoD family inhibitor domain-containing protein 2-like [Hyla sarda]XP_056397030.1 myoD family inhibitor domain-containing protein 2-like [Hyla sarda]XP_056410456.1 myoD family inhibitor domain-containing protein 2-like [Hyla sarda]XP_056410457.1 myoD family inhibitor domain-containing protein 2-like [Hyla sarda]XP_056410458.1 my
MRAGDRIHPQHRHNLQRYHKMSDCASSSAETLVRTSERLPPTKKTAKVHFGEIIVDHGDVQAVTQTPHQQILRSQDVTCSKKPKSSRRGSQRSSLQGPMLSASHIEEAAGDVSDLTASLLLACLFCHFSDCLVLLPGTCGTSVRCLCSYSCLPELNDLCCCCTSSCCTNTDCDFLDLCFNTAECLELAMEMSELCFH